MAGSDTSDATAVDVPPTKPVSAFSGFDLHALSPFHIIGVFIGLLYRLIQVFIRLFFAPYPPKEPIKPEEAYGRIAIIGAGVTGVSSAGHAVAAGFDVVIFEAEHDVGGIWARENRTSGLQLNSILYRFFPGIQWNSFYPHRDEILHEVKRIWKDYKLESKTRFGTKVTKVERDVSTSRNPADLGHARWVINDGAEGVFDAVVVSIGTCGEAKKDMKLKGIESFKGKVIHSSELDDIDMKGKKVLIVGSGASGVESFESAIEKGAGHASILARSDKWIIPRNMVADTILSMQPFGRETRLSFIPEYFLRKFHYRDLEWMSPVSKGIYEGTPIVNDKTFTYVREHKGDYLRGDVVEVVAEGIKFNHRKRGTKAGDKGEESVEKADVIILATGYARPTLDFLPQDLFPEGEHGDYKPPNLYLQVFATEDWSILMTNSAYVDAIGTVGHIHIGMYLRVLIAFLTDKRSRPLPKDMKLWVDVIRYVKGRSPKGALAFFSYMELCIWFVTFHMFRVERILWFPYILFGWGHPHTIKKTKDQIREQLEG